MKRRACCYLLAGVIAPIGLGWWLISREPLYEGKPLSFLLQQINQAGSVERAAPAAQAIESMGEKAIPHLVNFLGREETQTSIKVWRILTSQKIIPIKRSDPNALCSPALFALRMVGPKAESAIPELVSRLSETNWTSLANMAAIVAIGPGAIPAVEAACAHPDRNVRAQAAWILAALNHDHERTFQWLWSGGHLGVGLSPLHNSGALHQNLTNHSAWPVRSASIDAMVTWFQLRYRMQARALAQMRAPPPRFFSPEEQELKRMIALLKQAANDPNPNVRKTATDALKVLHVHLAAISNAK